MSRMSRPVPHLGGWVVAQGGHGHRIARNLEPPFQGDALSDHDTILSWGVAGGSDVATSDIAPWTDDDDDEGSIAQPEELWHSREYDVPPSMGNSGATRGGGAQSIVSGLRISDRDV